MDTRRHWDDKYASIEVTDLGWHEPFPGPSLKYISFLKPERDARILLCGAGTTTLADELVRTGFTDITCVDISSVAINLLRNRLGEKSEALNFIQADVLKAEEMNGISDVDIWLDRAVLHFFTSNEERHNYRENMMRSLKPGGHVIIGVFSSDCKSGKCSGLPVLRYDLDGLLKFMGHEFELLAHSREEYIMPSGDDRDYLYALFKRVE